VRWLSSALVDNQSHLARIPALRLDELPFRMPATIRAIDWALLSEADAKRLRNLGFDEGVEIETLHGAPFGKDPIAIRVGRMMVAMRRAQARAVSVELDELDLAAE
jgi:ferrous iron transport protein A